MLVDRELGSSHSPQHSGWGSAGSCSGDYFNGLKFFEYREPIEMVPNLVIPNLKVGVNELLTSTYSIGRVRLCKPV